MVKVGKSSNLYDTTKQKKYPKTLKMKEVCKQIKQNHFTFKKNENNL